MKKTNKAAAKRILKLTKGGKILRRTISAQHLASNKSKRSRRASNKKVALCPVDQSRIKKYL